MKTILQQFIRVLVVIPFLALPAGAETTSYVSKSLKEKTVTAPNGAVTVQDALSVNKLLGAHEKVVDEITKGVYHIRGWGIAHTIAIDAPEGWIIVDTGDTTKTASEMRERLEEKLRKKIEVAAILYTHSHYTDGTDAWLDEGAEIWGHEHLDKYKRADAGVSILGGNFQTRAATQFGVLHPSEGPDAFPNKLRDGFEVYGQVESHVKQVYNGRLGWMGNDVYDINPLSVNEETRRMVQMMGGTEKVASAARDAVEDGGFTNWSWALKLTSLLLEIDEKDAEARKIRGEAARALGQRTTSANARGWYITEALAMENKLKFGDNPVTLGMVRAGLGTPSVETVMSAPPEDSFQYVRYLVDPRKAEDARLAFTVSVKGTEKPTRIELRNGVIIISQASQKEEAHLDVSSKEWAEFVVGQRSFADRSKTVATFESVLARPSAPEVSEALDDQLEDVGEEVDDSVLH